MLIPWLGAPHAQRPRLLVIDGDRDYAHAAAQIMQTIEVEVDLADSLRVAIQAMATRRPRLVLLNALMQGLDSPNTIAKIRETVAPATTFIVLCSALEEAQLARWTAVCNADGYIPKSVGPIELRRRVLEWLVVRPSTQAYGVRPVG